jgi:Bacterial SH3 domain
MAPSPRSRPTRLDALARALWGRSGAATASRRGVLWGLAGLAAGGVLPRGGVARALDTGPDGAPDGAGAGDTGAGDACPPAAPPAAAPPVGAATLRPRAAAIYAGSCLDLGADPAFALLDVGLNGADAATPTADMGTVGAASAVAGQLSVTLLDVALADLYGQPHAIAVRADADGGAVVACGDVGGRLERQVAGEDLVLGLPERGNSGLSGIAWLRGDADRTLVHVFLAPGLGGGVGATQMVVIDDAVNVRNSPTTDAAVVGVLDRGARVTATGAAFAGWIPITDPATGVSGYVLAEFLQEE